MGHIVFRYENAFSSRSSSSIGSEITCARTRALITHPKVLLADEPTGALDSATSYEILKVLQDVQREGVTVVVITHERDIAAMTDRIVHLVDGQVAWDRRIERRDPAPEAVTEAVALP